MFLSRSDNDLFRSVSNNTLFAITLIAVFILGDLLIAFLLAKEAKQKGEITGSIIGRMIIEFFLNTIRFCEISLRLLVIATVASIIIGLVFIPGVDLVFFIYLLWGNGLKHIESLYETLTNSNLIV